MSFGAIDHSSCCPKAVQGLYLESSAGLSSANVLVFVILTCLLNCSHPKQRRLPILCSKMQPSLSFIFSLSSRHSIAKRYQILLQLTKLKMPIYDTNLYANHVTPNPFRYNI